MGFVIAIPPILSDGLGFVITKEEAWGTKEVVVVDSAVHARCTRQFALNARKSVKSLLNQETIVRYIVRIAIQSARTKADKRKVKEVVRNGKRISKVVQ